MSFSQDQGVKEIVESIKLEETQRNQGRLKIFLGMAVGVGKTYAMLEDAQTLKKEQIDVAIGYIETHGRKEIESLLQNIPQIPQKTLSHKNMEGTEMDVGAIISLNPSIVLVDELAHNNFPGSKNGKRWQDVQELLDHGINVNTTLNIQHINSLNEIVLGITGIVVNETVPDIMIDKAHSIQLIDLTPDELLQRLKEGKVYTEGQSETAIHNFFKKNKLAALRETMLRYVADKIDVDLMHMATTKEGKIERHNREKFLVAISEALSSQKLIKATRQLAIQANAPWAAVYVNTGKPLSEEASKQLEKNLMLTRSLGSEGVIIYDLDVAEGIKRVAHQRNITQVIFGRTKKKFSLFQGPTLLDRLAAECKGIDLHIIRQEKGTATDQRKWSLQPGVAKFSHYLLASFFVCLLAGLSWVALPVLGNRVVQFLFFISVSAFSFFFTRGPSILAAILFGTLWGLIFTPLPTESSSMTEDMTLLILYVLTAISFGLFVERFFWKKESLKKSDKKTLQLADILHCLDGNLSPDRVLLCLEERLPTVVNGTFKLIVKNKNGTLDTDNIALLPGDKERLTALSAFTNSREAGWSTETLPLSDNLYLPIKGSRETMGLLIYRSPDKRILTKEEKHLLYHLCQQLGNYLEK